MLMTKLKQDKQKKALMKTQRDLLKILTMKF